LSAAGKHFNDKVVYQGNAVERILSGSDAATGANSPKRRRENFLRLPLSEGEFKTITNNVPPYLR